MNDPQPQNIYLLESSTIPHNMAAIPPWSSSICYCISETVARVTSPQRLYEAHAKSAPQCPWFLRARQTREEEEWRTYTAEAIRISVETVQKQLQSMQQVSSSIKQQQEQQKVEQARLLKERQEAEEARMAQEREEAEKFKAEAFACRRCPEKFPSNTKLHEHVRNHHSKKPKPAVSSIPPATPPQSVTSSPKSSPLSDFPPVFVPKLSEEAEEARMAQEREEAEKVKLEAFACRRCPAKFASNTKLHEHVRNRHAKKPKPALSSTPSTPPATPSQLVTSLPKYSLLSDSAPEFLPKRSESAPLTRSSTPQKPDLLRPTPPSQIPSETPYLTIDDLSSMFPGDTMRAKLLASQNSPPSPGVSASQMRITSYFLPTSKSTNFGAST